MTAFDVGDRVKLELLPPAASGERRFVVGTVDGHDELGLAGCTWDDGETSAEDGEYLWRVMPREAT